MTALDHLIANFVLFEIGRALVGCHSLFACLLLSAALC
jgi:hypothetical protein